MSKPAPISTPDEAKSRFVSNLNNLFDIVSLAAADLKSKGCDVVNPTMIKLAKTGLFEIAKIKNTDIPLVFLKTSYPYWDEIYAENVSFVEQNLFKFVLSDADDEKSKEICEICKNITSQILGAKDSQGQYLMRKDYMDRIGVLLKGMISLSVKYAFFLRNPVEYVDGRWKFEKNLSDLKDLPDFSLNKIITKYRISGLPTRF